MTKPTFVKG